MADDDVEYESESFHIGPHSFSVTTISFMPLEKLLENQTKGVEISGQKVWCGSVVVSEYMLRNPEIVRNKCVVELGSGTGIVGMMCHRLGAGPIFFTDHDIRSIHNMTVDVITNNITNCSIHVVDWFQEGHCERLLQEVRVALTTKPIDLLVVAGDVLYKSVLLSPFMRTAKRILMESNFIESTSLPSETFTDHSQWKLLLCHVPRAGVEQSDVIAAAIEFGLGVSIVDSSEWKSGAVLEIIPEEDYERAQLYILQLPVPTMNPN